MLFQNVAAYEEQLEEAHRYRRLALRKLDQHTELFRQKLRAEARRAKQQGYDYHTKASELFFALHNTDEALASGTIDLHYLTKIEAWSKTAEFLKNNTGIISVVTGRGNHSQHNKAIIREHIIDNLIRFGYVYRLASNNKGVIEINLDMSTSIIQPFTPMLNPDNRSRRKML